MARSQVRLSHDRPEKTRINAPQLPNRADSGVAGAAARDQDRVRADLATLATKDDLANLVTKDDLANLVTKAELATFRDDLRAEVQADKADLLNWMLTALTAQTAQTALVVALIRFL